MAPRLAEGMDPLQELSAGALGIILIKLTFNKHHTMSAIPSASAATSTSPLSAEELELAEITVKTLNLDVAANEIDPEAPLYGEGLGLDSIDILEISLAISKQYGFQLKSDDANNKVIYKSLRNLCAHVQANRTK
jgi:acyl carrier protein